MHEQKCKVLQGTKEVHLQVRSRVRSSVHLVGLIGWTGISGHVNVMQRVEHVKGPVALCTMPIQNH